MLTLHRRALAAAFYRRPTLKVAKALLGKVLIHRTAEGTAAGMIVETEAYIGEDDPACHAAVGATRRNAPLYEFPGIAYVYLNYGIHFLFNVVTEAKGRPAAVLVRALEPLEGEVLMHRRRAGNGRRILSTELCRGPGNLSRAMGITLDNNYSNLTADPLWIENLGRRVQHVRWGPRIGIRVGLNRPWRCWIDGHPSISGPRSVSL
jgi:DNA-3-methyladenine glycosylase